MTLVALGNNGVDRLSNTKFLTDDQRGRVMVLIHALSLCRGPQD